jgi:hypothetical protein
VILGFPSRINDRFAKNSKEANVTNKRSKWRQIQCSSCGGHGMLPAYTADGGDFIGAEEGYCHRISDGGARQHVP